MSRMVKKVMVVLLSAFMFMGVMTTPVQAKESNSGTNGWNPWSGWWGWWWPTQPEQPEPEPVEEPVVEEETPEEPEEPVIEETPVVDETPIAPEEPVIDEEPVYEETPAVEEYPAAIFTDAESSETVTVNVDAPEGAFTSDTVINVNGITEEAAESHMAAAVQTLDCNEIVDSRIVSISFENEEGTQEPNAPVTVTVNFTTPLAEAESYAVIHILDDGSTEIIQDAVITREYATFTAGSFSTYEVLAYTNRHSEVNTAGAITFSPSDIPGVTAIATIPSGNIADNAPQFEGYTFVNATTVVDGQTVEVVQIGAFTAVYDVVDDKGTEDKSDDTTTQREDYKVYYRTPETLESSDIIVLITEEGETITLNYEATPLKITYQVVYNNQTYAIGTDELPEEIADVVLNGPVSVKQDVAYEDAIEAAIPRGYSATLSINGTNKGSLGESTEPTYTVDSNNKIITKSGELKLEGTYDIDATRRDQVVTLTVTKRNSFTFDASKFLSTVYTGGS